MLYVCVCEGRGRDKKKLVGVTKLAGRECNFPLTHTTPSSSWWCDAGCSSSPETKWHLSPSHGISVFLSLSVCVWLLASSRPPPPSLHFRFRVSLRFFIIATNGQSIALLFLQKNANTHTSSKLRVKEQWLKGTREKE